MKLTQRDKVILIVLSIAALIFGVYKLVFVPTTVKIAKLNEEKVEAEALSTDITPVLEQRNKLKTRETELIRAENEIKNGDSAPTATNEEFLVFLGESTARNNVQLTGFNDFGMSEEDGVYTATSDFELRGLANNINVVLREIDELGVRTSFGSISFRQNEDYEYLKRYFDELTELPWYTEPEEKEEPEETKEISEPQIEENQEPQEEPTFVDVMPEITVPVPVTPDVFAPIPSLPEKIQEKEKWEEPPKEDKTINDRLNSLLENTSARRNDYKVVFLTNTVETPMIDTISNMEDDVLTPNYGAREMRLAVTVKIIMFSEPQFDTSILNRGVNSNEVL